MSKDMVANPKKKTLADSIPHEQKPPKDPHEGKVERKLNTRDRNLILMAATQKARNGDYKAMAKLERLKSELNAKEVDEYFAMIVESYEDKEIAWVKAKSEWLNQKGPKPDGKRPEAKPEELRGKTRSFWFASPLDAYVIECLKECKWGDPRISDFVTELCEKYGLKGEE